MDVKASKVQMLNDIANCLFTDLSLDSSAYIRFRGQPVARLIAGNDFYHPGLVLLLDNIGSNSDEPSKAALDNGDLDNGDIQNQNLYENLDANLKGAKLNLEAFLRHNVSELLGSILNLRNAVDFDAQGRLVADALFDNYGFVPRDSLADVLKALDQTERAKLRKYGIRFGRFHVYIPSLLKPSPVKLLMTLWRTYNEGSQEQIIATDTDAGDWVLSELSRGRTTIVNREDIPQIYYKLAGYDFWADSYIRIDISERLSSYIQAALNWKEGDEVKPAGAYGGKYFVVTPSVLSILGIGYEKASEILQALGYTSRRIDYDAEKVDEVVKIKQVVEQSEPNELKPIENENANVLTGEDTALAGSETQCLQDSGEVERENAEPEFILKMDIWTFKKPSNNKNYHANRTAKTRHENHGKGGHASKAASRKHNKHNGYKRESGSNKKAIDMDSPFAILLQLQEKNNNKQ